jgi:uncharacterized protein
MRAFVLAALLGYTAIFPAIAEAQSGSMYNQTITGTRLELSATGETRVTPDIAIINAGVITEAPDAATAMDQNAAKMVRVMAAIFIRNRSPLRRNIGILKTNRPS